MLNGLGEYQKIIVLGGKSDLAISILEDLPISDDADLYLFARNISDFDLPGSLARYEVHRIEQDFAEVEGALEAVKMIFELGDVDLVVFAYAILGSEDYQLQRNLLQEVLHTNFFSQAILLNEVNSALVKQLHGQIMVISSVAGQRPRRRNFIYGISKLGIDFIAQGLQKINLDKNVFITIVRPGFIYTKMTQNLPPAPFAIDRKKASRIAVNGLLKNKRIVYAPKFLSIIMLVLRILPERVFRIIDK